MCTTTGLAPPFASGARLALRREDQEHRKKGGALRRKIMISPREIVRTWDRPPRNAASTLEILQFVEGRTQRSLHQTQNGEDRTQGSLHRMQTDKPECRFVFTDCRTGKTERRVAFTECRTVKTERRFPFTDYRRSRPTAGLP
jgi:hypothetical protein